MKLMKTLGILSCATLFCAPLALGEYPAWAETMSQQMSETDKNVEASFPPGMLAGM